MEAGAEQVQLVFKLLAVMLLGAAQQHRTEKTGRAGQAFQRLLVAEIKRQGADDRFAARLFGEECDLDAAGKREAFDAFFKVVGSWVKGFSLGDFFASLV